MSISSSLNNALSGLSAASRMADIVASNTANAMTEGYARRELSLESRSLGGNGAGVRISGVTRVTNEIVLQDLRLANAAMGNAETLSDFYTRVEGAVGSPDDTDSLSAKIAELESALIEASSRPDSQARLSSVLSAAIALTDHLNGVSDTLQDLRMEADQKIADQVDVLNESLTRIDDLNSKILAEKSAGHDATALMDERQALVDKISDIVPVRQKNLDNEQIALYTTGGAILLEGNPTVIGFDQSGVITPQMSQEGGALSGLTINGMSVYTGEGGVLSGGSLGALFEMRDTLAPEIQTQIDAFARDLIERFADPSLDATLNSGDAGLFTDSGAAFDTANELGLAGRISISDLVNPAEGGDLFRLRDGLGSGGASTTTGDSSLINGMIEALSASRLPSTGSFSDGPNSVSELAADLLSQISSGRLNAEDTETYQTSRQSALKEMALADGVDTDYEMQMLLRVEQVYAANAKVIQTIDALISTMLEL